MKKIIILLFILNLTAFTADSKKPSTPTEKFSYAVGMQIGDDFRSKEMKLRAGANADIHFHTQVPKVFD